MTCQAKGASAFGTQRNSSHKASVLWMLAPPVKPGETALPWRVQPVSSAFTRSVTAALGSSEGTPSTTIQMPGVSTLPVSTPRQTTGSSVGTETVPTAEEFTQSSSHWTPTAPQGPSTPFFVWTLRNYKVIPATDGIRKPDSRAPCRAPAWHFLSLFLF